MSKYRIAESGYEKFTKTNKTVFPTSEKSKKFNLKLSQGDLDFVKFLSEKQGVTKNQILDDIVKSIILDFLNSLDRNENILLVKIADRLNNIDTLKNIEASWISDLYPTSTPYNEMHHDLYNQSKANDLSKNSGIAGDDRSETYYHILKLISESKILQKNSLEDKNDA